MRYLSMRQELKKKTKSSKKATEISKLLKDLFHLHSGNTAKKKGLRNLLGLEQGQHSPVTLKSLYELYSVASRLLTQEYRLETIQTPYEDSFAIFLQQNTKIQFFRTVWIGNNNSDFIFPRTGIVLEVNGEIHNNEVKMKKDIFRDKKIMEKLKIPVMEIENCDLHERRHSILFDLTKTRDIGTLKVRNMWRKIYIETIACQFDKKQLSHVFKCDIASALDLCIEMS